MGVGEATGDSKKPAIAADDLSKIAGQKAIVTKARKSIAGFKVREFMPIGAKVTLRSDRMYEFLDRLVTIALPRVRDFRGLNAKSFRWPWQLRHGRQGAYRFPRDQLRQGRSDLGNGHHRLYDCEDGRRGPGRCSRLSTSPSASNGQREKEQASTWPRQVQSRRTRGAARWSSVFLRPQSVREAQDRSSWIRASRYEERFRAQLELAAMPRNSSKTPHPLTVGEVDGRPRGYYRKLKMSRNLRWGEGELGANNGLKSPVLVKSSW